MAQKIIIGSINEKTISRVIHNYLSTIPEEELTAKREIRDEF